MSIYEEMSMYGDIFIIDTQILIHAHPFSPPVFTLCGNGVVAPLRRKLTIGGNQEVELVSKVWLPISPPTHPQIAMPTWSLVSKNLVV
jgi:hypothetical protein